MRGMKGLSVLSLAIAANLQSVSARAADSAEADNKTLEEIVVTAQKREERLIDVPTSINVVSAETLASQNIEGVFDYYSRIPGLSYSGNKTYDLSLRGITTGGATNPTLAILVDDIQFGSSTAAGLGNSLFPDFDPAMLDSIEVLHGPQGTLYGAASLGGLIKFVTRQPDTEKFFGRVEAGFESVSGGGIGWTTRGSVNLPLMSDKLALNVSAFTRWDPAYITNINSGTPVDDVNKTHTWGGHASLLFKPMDNLSITLSALEQKRHAAYSNSTAVNVDDNGVPNYIPTYGKDTINTGATSDIGDQQLYSARIVLGFDNFEITSLSSYGKSAGTNFQDVSTVFTFLPAPPFYNLPGASVFIDDAAQTKKITQELRVSGKVPNVLDWRFGLYYTREYGSVDQTLKLYNDGALVALPYVGLGPDYYKERAVFGDVVFHATEQLDLQAGVRYAKNSQLIGGSTVIDGPAQLAFGPSSVAPNLLSDDSSVTWAFSPTYHFTHDVMAYARVATGYRPGGPNAILPNVPSSFAPDKVINYEVGFKGLTSDHSFSWEASLFQINWDHVQLQDTDAATEFTYTTNGGKARSRGLEATLNWKPYQGLNVSYTATFMDAVLTEDLVAPSGADGLVGRSGDRLPSSSKFSHNVDVQQDFPIAGDFTGDVGANWSFVGTRKSAFQSTSDGAAPRFDLPSYNLFDLRAGLNYGHDLHLNLFIRNVTDKRGVVFADNRNGTSTTFARFLQPRTVGLSLSKEF